VIRIFLALMVLIEAGFLIMGRSRRIMGLRYSIQQKSEMG
jgi:hypothetical protein